MFDSVSLPRPRRVRRAESMFCWSDSNIMGPRAFGRGILHVTGNRSRLAMPRRPGSVLRPPELAANILYIVGYPHSVWWFLSSWQIGTPKNTNENRRGRPTPVTRLSSSRVSGVVAVFAGAVYNRQRRAATMKSRNLPILGLAIIFFCLLSARGAALSIEEAESLSQRTGRPLLAVLGPDTCGLTQAVLGHLKGPAGPLRLAVCERLPPCGRTRRDELGKEVRQAGGDDASLCLRAAGRRREALQPQRHHGERGTPRVVGRPGGEWRADCFPPKKEAVLKKALEEAKQARKKGDAGEAVKSLLPLKKLGPLGGLNSYAKPAVDANQLVAQLTKEGKATLKEADEKLSSGDAAFAAALAYARAKRVYTPLTTLKTELNVACASTNACGNLADTFRQAESLDRARGNSCIASWQGEGRGSFPEDRFGISGNGSGQVGGQGT